MSKKVAVKKIDRSLIGAGSILFGAIALRVGYEIYQIRSRMNRLENYLEKNDIPIISQKPLISTSEYFVIADVPKAMYLNTEYVVTITLFTKDKFEIIPNSLTVTQLIKPSLDKAQIQTLPTSDISQGNRTLQIPFNISGLQKGTTYLTVDFTFQIQSIDTKTKQEIKRKVILPLCFVKV